MKKIHGLSLFANVGVAELLLKDTKYEVKVANELIEQRVKFYSHVYPEVTMIQGDITDKKIFSKVMEESKKNNVEFIMATPPCQGMSSAGKQDPFDPRNQLITYAIDAILELKPKYVFLENVPQQLKTEITYQGKRILVPDFIERKLSKFYNFDFKGIVEMDKFGIPQMRKRSIFLLSRKDVDVKWSMPKMQMPVTLKEVIGNLPDVDPYVKDADMSKLFPDYEKKKKEAAKISPLHRPPVHALRHVIPMMHTPTGKSAFANADEYKPKLLNGRVSKGFKNTYKRQNWDKPAYTVTMYNGVIGSQENGHPGIKMKNGLWSNPRVLTLYELLLVSTIPTDWNIPNWASENLIRHVVGEAIPPLIIKKLFERI